MKLDLPFPDGEHAEPVSMVLLTIRITSFVNYLLVHVSVYDWMALLGQEGFVDIIVWNPLCFWMLTPCQMYRWHVPCVL